MRDRGTDLRLRIVPNSMWRGGGDSGFAKTRTVPVGRARHGVNSSATHIDVMIGTDRLEASGVTEQGRAVTLVRDGAWQI